jgi:hypothetical protein
MVLSDKDGKCLLGAGFEVGNKSSIFGGDAYRAG